MNTPRRLAALFALLMLLSTAAFVVGASVEKDQRRSEPGVAEAPTEQGSETHREGGSEEGEGATPPSEGSESIGGIDLENTPLVVLGAALSIALAGAALRWPRREVFGVAIAFCLGFAVLDGRELSHQLSEDANRVAVLAGLTLGLHLAVAAAAVLAIARAAGDRSSTTSA